MSPTFLAILFFILFCVIVSRSEGGAHCFAFPSGCESSHHRRRVCAIGSLGDIYIPIVLVLLAGYQPFYNLLVVPHIPAFRRPYQAILVLSLNTRNATIHRSRPFIFTGAHLFSEDVPLSHLPGWNVAPQVHILSGSLFPSIKDQGMGDAIYS